MMETHESISRLSRAFNLSESRSATYIGELEAAGVDAAKLEEAIGWVIRNLDRCPSIADLIRRCAGTGEGAKQLSLRETRDLIERRLRHIDPNKPVTEDRVNLHWAQFAEEFAGRFAHQASYTPARRTIATQDEYRVGKMIFALSKQGIVWDHMRNRWTNSGEKPTPLTPQERDDMRLRGWRPPLPPRAAIVTRHEAMQREPVAAPTDFEKDILESFDEVPF
jgi:hypothetical protein